jgi:hypothetical protein
MINPRNLKVRLGYFAGSLLLLLIFSITHLPAQRGLVQREFDQWVGEIEPRLRNPGLTETPAPSVVVEVESPSSALHLRLALNPSATTETSERMARILEMAREANLFSPPSRPEGKITLKIETEKRVFAVRFNPADITNNAPAQSMIKLLDLYMKVPVKEADNEKS